MLDEVECSAAAFIGSFEDHDGVVYEFVFAGEVFLQHAQQQLDRCWTDLGNELLQAKREWAAMSGGDTFNAVA